MKTRITSEVQLAGGMIQCDDGTWRVECVFSGLEEREAGFLSAWLERLIMVHICDVAENTDAVQMRPH